MNQVPTVTMLSHLLFMQRRGFVERVLGFDVRVLGVSLGPGQKLDSCGSFRKLEVPYLGSL